VSTSERKIAANRLNGQKSHGPNNTTSTRFNATKHGLLAVGVTELDDAEGYRTTLHELMLEKNPVGPTETFLVESAALDMVRWKRARRLEAEHITSVLNPPIREGGLVDVQVFDGTTVDPGLPAVLELESIQPLVTTFQRYESTFALRLFRTLHEFERIQRMRRGEKLPAPAAADVILAAENKPETPFIESQ